MFVGVLRLSFHLPGNGSLKGKRRVVRSMIERTRAKFNASVAEVADNDLHRKAVIGVTVVANDSAHVHAMLGNIGRFIEGMGVAVIASVETEVISLGGDIGPGLIDGGTSAMRENELFAEGGEIEEEEW